MTEGDHNTQRARVRRSLDADEARDHHHDVYRQHPLSKAVPQGDPTVASLAQSIRELGEMLAVADQHPDWSTRTPEVERLAVRIGDRVGQVLALVRDEYAEAGGMGTSDGLGGYVDKPGPDLAGDAYEAWREK